MSATTTTATPITEAQIAYIRDLIDRAGRPYRLRRRDLDRDRQDREARGIAYEARDLARWQAERDASDLLAELWSKVALPLDQMTQAQASTVIERLKGTTAAPTIVGALLDNAKMARTYGVADFVEANRAAIERALKF